MIPNKREMLEKLNMMGVVKIYKPYAENDGTTFTGICLQTRKPAKIVDGKLEGCEINIFDSETFRIWTNQKSKAMQVARDNKFVIRLLDGEAELFIPADRADDFLHSFGAKVKYTRKQSQKSIDAIREINSNRPTNNPTTAKKGL